MSALDVANQLMDSDMQARIAIEGQDKIQENVLQQKVDGDATRTEFHEGSGGLTSGKEGYSAFTELGKVGQKGVGEYLGAQAEELSKAPAALVRSTVDRLPGGAGVYLKKGAKFVGNKAAGALESAAKSVVGGDTYTSAKEAAQTFVATGGTETRGAGLYDAKGVKQTPDADPFAGTDARVTDDFMEEGVHYDDFLGADLHASNYDTGGLFDEPAGPSAEEIQRGKQATSSMIQGGRDALAAQTGETTVASRSDELASGILKNVSELKGGFATLGKVAGFAGGAMALGEDLLGGKIAGDNADEKEGNKLTIASTVMDFIPGLEPIGLALGADAAIHEFKGSQEADKDTQGKDQDALTNLQNTDRPPPVASWSQMGLVASMAPNAIHQNVGNVHL